MVRTLACHARGRRFEPVPSRQFAAMAQLAEHVLGKDEVTRSNRVSSSNKTRLVETLSGFFVFIFEIFSGSIRSTPTFIIEPI